MTPLKGNTTEPADFFEVSTKHEPLLSPDETIQPEELDSPPGLVTGDSSGTYQEDSAVKKAYEDSSLKNNGSQRENLEILNETLSDVEHLFGTTDRAKAWTRAHYGILGILKIFNDPELNTLAIGIDPLTLGINLNSHEPLHATFGTPWLNVHGSKAPDAFSYLLPSCYTSGLTSAKPVMREFDKIDVQTLFYIFYNVPQEFMQGAAAMELACRNWLFHAKTQRWYTITTSAESNEAHKFEEFDPVTWKRRQVSTPDVAQFVPPVSIKTELNTALRNKREAISMKMAAAAAASHPPVSSAPAKPQPPTAHVSSTPGSVPSNNCTTTTANPLNRKPLESGPSTFSAAAAAALAQPLPPNLQQQLLAAAASHSVSSGGGLSSYPQLPRSNVPSSLSHSLHAMVQQQQQVQQLSSVLPPSFASLQASLQSGGAAASGFAQPAQPSPLDSSSNQAMLTAVLQAIRNNQQQQQQQNVNNATGGASL